MRRGCPVGRDAGARADLANGGDGIGADTGDADGAFFLGCFRGCGGRSSDRARDVSDRVSAAGAWLVLGLGAHRSVTGKCSVASIQLHLLQKTCQFFRVDWLLEVSRDVETTLFSDTADVLAHARRMTADDDQLSGKFG